MKNKENKKEGKVRLKSRLRLDKLIQIAFISTDLHYNAKKQLQKVVTQKYVCVTIDKSNIISVLFLVLSSEIIYL